EMMHMAAARYDQGRLGLLFLASSVKSDVMIIAGTLINKMASPNLVGLFLWVHVQMMVDITIILTMLLGVNIEFFSTGLFILTAITYILFISTSCDRIVPVDIYVPGCPTTAEALLYSAFNLR
ncbi:4028_t:CDS:2, partial [Gigaspora rosea]